MTKIKLSFKEKVIRKFYKRLVEHKPTPIFEEFFKNEKAKVHE